MTPRKNGLEKSANAGGFLKERVRFLPGEPATHRDQGRPTDFTKLVYHHGILSVAMRTGER